VTRRLLFDQNLSPRLVNQVADRFQGSLHVLDVGLSVAPNAEVLEFAHGQDLVVVTKDKDFADLVTSRGNGPRILWVMLGNVTTDEISKAILDDADSIHRLLDDPDVQIVQLTRRPRY
jgi:predicted nuclease of predicted toxin-antitoxin system